MVRIVLKGNFLLLKSLITTQSAYFNLFCRTTYIHVSFRSFFHKILSNLNYFVNNLETVFSQF